MHDEGTAHVDRQWVIERQGRQMVLYAGLLDLAHRKGLRRITTNLIQVPTAENGQTAIVWAEVDVDGSTFSGLGDANPGNLSRQILPHAIRMAETRAKARALRDAVNVGTVAFEEMGGEDEEVTAPVAGPPIGRADPGSLPRTVAAPAAGWMAAGEKATEAQIRAIYAIGRGEHHLEAQDVEDRAVAKFGRVPDQLSKREASDLITFLKQPAPEETAPKTDGGGLW